MDELLQALDIAIMEELLLEIRYRLPVRVDLAGLGGGTLWRGHGHIARRQHLHLAVDSRRKLEPLLRVRIGGGTGAASEESAQSQISEGEAEGIGRKSEGIRRGLIIDGIPGVQG